MLILKMICFEVLPVLSIITILVLLIFFFTNICISFSLPTQDLAPPPSPPTEAKGAGSSTGSSTGSSGVATARVAGGGAWGGV